jgi:translation elongation factor EF-Ts
MDITLKKIDLIRERTGVSYREAKYVLEQAEGNVIEALIQLEDQKKDWKKDVHTWKEEFTVKGTEVADKVKEVLRKGNVHKITIKQDGKKVVEIPVVLGALGGLLLPELAV